MQKKDSNFILKDDSDNKGIYGDDYWPFIYEILTWL